MLRLGILGYPLRHTASPAMHRTALEAVGLAGTYEVWEVPPEGLAEAVARLRAEGVRGFNVTVPHKTAILPLLDRLEETARRLGAVNTVVNEGGRLEGWNTDRHGFLKGLEEAGFRPPGCTALVLGAGGSARTVALALAWEGARAVLLANRTPERAQALARAVAEEGAEAQALPLEPSALAPALEKVDLVVNCTVVGMRHGPAEGRSPLPPGLLARLPPSALVYDLVYNPPETPLLAEARRVGLRTQDGVAMLVHQGAQAFTLWTGRAAPVSAMRRAVEAFLAGV